MSKVQYMFIVGVSRTGSKFYLQLFNTHPDFSILPEVNFRHRYKKDLYSLIRKKINGGASHFELVDWLYTLEWKDTFHDVLDNIPKGDFLDWISDKELSPYVIFEGMIFLYSKGRNVIGAKFPVHYQYSEDLAEEFQGSKIVLLIRDPRDVFCSDAIMKRKWMIQTRYGRLITSILRPMVLFFTIFNFSKYLSYIDLLKEKMPGNVMTCRYEDISNSQGLLIDQIAKFSGVSRAEFRPDLVERKGSSFSDHNSSGRWREILRSHEIVLFRMFLARKMSRYGYTF